MNAVQPGIVHDAQRDRADQAIVGFAGQVQWRGAPVNRDPFQITPFEDVLGAS